MTLTAYQASFNGYTIGAGTDVQLSKIKGLRGMPNLRTGDVARARRNGSFPGLNFFDERIPELDLEVWASSIPSGSTIEQVLTSVATAFENIEDPANQLPLSFMLPNFAEPRLLFCRPINLDLDIDTNYQYGKIPIAVQLTANDPLIYSSTLHTASAGLPSPTAGLTFPVTFPVTFGASTGGSMSVTNAGKYATPPLITIQGPVTTPTVSLGGLFMTLNISLGSTDYIVIDMNARTILLNGTASRSNTVATGSSWWAIPPGTSSIGVASTDAAQVAALFTVQWRDAWGTQ